MKKKSEWTVQDVLDVYRGTEARDRYRLVKLFPRLSLALAELGAGARGILELLGLGTKPAALLDRYIRETLGLKKDDEEEAEVPEMPSRETAAPVKEPEKKVKGKPNTTLSRREPDPEPEPEKKQATKPGKGEKVKSSKEKDEEAELRRMLDQLEGKGKSGDDGESGEGEGGEEGE